MKTKFFFLIVLFLAIGAMSYAQTETAAPAEKKDAPAQVATPAQGTTVGCPGHQAGTAKADCKWVDANNDGKCDTCGKTEKECKEKCASTTSPKKEGCGASCPMHKECMGSSGKAPETEPKK